LPPTSRTRLSYSKVPIDLDQIKTEKSTYIILFVEELSYLFFDLPLMAASSLRGSHEKDYCPIDSCPIDSADMLGRYG
jgi:hypothetical protein